MSDCYGLHYEGATGHKWLETFDLELSKRFGSASENAHVPPEKLRYTLVFKISANAHVANNHV